VRVPDEHNRYFSSSASTSSNHKDHLSQLIELCEKWPCTIAKGSIDAGYTYLGQFIAHEIADGSNPSVARSAAFELDSIYGDGWDDPAIGKLNGAGKFSVYRPVENGMVGAPTDLCRAGKVAQIKEPRNDENLLIAQFHLLVLRFHNAVVQEANRTGVLGAFDPGNVFQHAREFVTFSIQQIVKNDYLKQILDPRVYLALTSHDLQILGLANTRKPLPLEFSKAAFRFGHSMVRPVYRLSPTFPDASIEQLFLLTERGGLMGGAQVTQTHRVDWRGFFRYPGYGGLQSATRIDPSITSFRAGIHSPGPLDIVERNLVAGINSGIASGQSIAAELLKMQPDLMALGISSELPISDSAANNLTSSECRQLKLDLLKNAAAHKHTPLWLFILIEGAESEAHGNHLGPLGSLLVGSVIIASLKLTQGGPNVLKHHLPPINTIQDLIKFTIAQEQN